MMQAPSLLCYFLLLWLCRDLCPAEGGPGRRQRRRMPPRAGHRSPRAAGLQPPGPRIPLITIDDSVMGVFDSLVGLGQHESTYSVLPGKKGQCTANGMIMFDKAVWSPQPCVTCLCSQGQVICDTAMCHPLTCPQTVIPAGECCPMCSETGAI
ncbi:extracellular matrix protein 2-like [Geospiza fortis]|uniref:Extracellular matrix protein 2-like n=1 Tax=Geospiza fortis TaxID=48883 RepID=A0A8N5HSI2_GEOFO|nr:extracellular matrix protein 2-like [Geospiza fortis]